jgi:hypothetical protein
MDRLSILFTVFNLETFETQTLTLVHSNSSISFLKRSYALCVCSPIHSSVAHRAESAGYRLNSDCHCYAFISFLRSLWSRFSSNASIGTKHTMCQVKRLVVRSWKHIIRVERLLTMITQSGLRAHHGVCIVCFKFCIAFFSLSFEVLMRIPLFRPMIESRRVQLRTTRSIYLNCYLQSILRLCHWIHMCNIS